MLRIVKNQCQSNREFPEFFKTHPTLISRLIVKASRSLQTKPAMLSDRTCIVLYQTAKHYHSLSSWWSKKNQNEEQFNSLYKIYHQTFSRLYLNLSGRAIKLYLFFRLVLLLLFPRQVELGWDNSCISYYEIWFEFKLKLVRSFIPTYILYFL